MVSQPTPFPPAGFRRFWLGEAVSSFGSYITLLALQTLVVLTLHGTAQDVGWLNAARWLPYLLLGLIVGALIDRRRRRPVMITTDLARALLLIMIPVSWAAGLLSLPLLLIIVAVFGAASLANDAASQSFLPRLVPRDHLQRAHARIDGADAVAQTSGPVLAGLLVKVLGAPLAVLADALTYLFSAAVVWSLRTPDPKPDHGAALPDLRVEIGDGVRWVYGRSGLARLAVATHVWFAANAVIGTVVAPFALTTLGLTPFQFGICTALAGVGGLLGALVSTAGGRRFGLGGAVIIAHLMGSAGAVAMACAGFGHGWTAVAVLGLGQACHGFGLSFGNSHEMSYRQALTPDNLQARTNITMRAFNRAVMVIMAPLAGLLAVQLGSRPTLLGAAVVFAFAVVLLALSPFRRARIPEDAPVVEDQQ